MTHDELKQITVTETGDSEVTIAGEIPFTELEKHRAAAVTHIGKDLEIDGFRKGHIPEKILVERVGEMAILSEMAERALRDVYPAVVESHKLEVIGYPKINITKLAAGNPLGFSATIAVVPTVTLPDYKKIATAQNTHKETAEVSDEEVEQQITEILRQKVAYERLQKKAVQKNNTDSQDTELPTPDTVDTKEEEEEEEEKLPELTDAYVQQLGKPGQFKDVADFKAKIREHLSIEKKKEVASAHRSRITDAIVNETDVTLPQILIDAEINQMLAQMQEDLDRAQLKMEDYLAHIKKTKEELTTEWKPAAEKRAKLQLILNEIAKQEGITADTGAVDHEVSHLLEQYKDADERRIRIYVTSVLTNEAVLHMLEGLGASEK